MSTFASDFIEGFDARWSEVDTLIDIIVAQLSRQKSKIFIMN